MAWPRPPSSSAPLGAAGVLRSAPVRDAYRQGAAYGYRATAPASTVAMPPRARRLGGGPTAAARLGRRACRAASACAEPAWLPAQALREGDRPMAPAAAPISRTRARRDELHALQALDAALRRDAANRSRPIRRRPRSGTAHRQARVQAHNWRLMALGCLLLSLLLAGAFCGSAGPDRPRRSSSRSIATAACARSAPAAENYEPTDAQIAFHLARFIENVRALSIDPVVVRQNWLRGLRLRHRPRRRDLERVRARATIRSPRIGRITVAVEIASVVRASDSLVPGALARAHLRERRRQGYQALHRPLLASSSPRRAPPSSCARTRSASTCTPSTGRRTSAAGETK